MNIIEQKSKRLYLLRFYRLFFYQYIYYKLYIDHLTNLFIERMVFMNNNVENKWEDAEMLTAQDIASILHVPVSTGYTIIRQLNKELKAQGKFVLRGRINSQYFRNKIIP